MKTTYLETYDVTLTTEDAEQAKTISVEVHSDDFPMTRAGIKAEQRMNRDTGLTWKVVQVERAADPATT